MGNGTLLSSDNIVILLILLIIFCIYKDRKDSYTPINWKDAETIGQRIYEPPREFRGPQDVYARERAYAQERICRKKKDDELAKKTPRRPLKNEGHAFVKSLITQESFETPHYSNTCDEVSQHERLRNHKRITPRSSVNMYYKYPNNEY